MVDWRCEISPLVLKSLVRKRTFVSPRRRPRNILSAFLLLGLQSKNARKQSSFFSQGYARAAKKENFVWINLRPRESSLAGKREERIERDFRLLIWCSATGQAGSKKWQLNLSILGGRLRQVRMQCYDLCVTTKINPYE